MARVCQSPDLPTRCHQASLSVIARSGAHQSRWDLRTSSSCMWLPCDTGCVCLHTSCSAGAAATLPEPRSVLPEHEPASATHLPGLGRVILLGVSRLQAYLGPREHGLRGAPQVSLPGTVLLLASPGCLGLLLLAEALEVDVLVDLPAQLPSGLCAHQDGRHSKTSSGQSRAPQNKCSRRAGAAQINPPAGAQRGTAACWFCVCALVAVEPRWNMD